MTEQVSRDQREERERDRRDTDPDILVVGQHQPETRRGRESRLPHVRRVEIAHFTPESQIVDRIAADIRSRNVPPWPVRCQHRSCLGDPRLHCGKPLRTLVGPVGLDESIHPAGGRRTATTQARMAAVTIRDIESVSSNRQGIVWPARRLHMGIQRIVICEVKVPFVHGGAEYLVRALRRQLRAHGYQAELVEHPVSMEPETRNSCARGGLAAHRPDRKQRRARSISRSARNCRRTSSRHPNKVAWLMHQHRAAYELCGTEHQRFLACRRRCRAPQTLIDLDRRDAGRMPAHLRQSRAIPANRLKKFNGLDAEPLYHPPPFADRLRPGPYGNYVLFVGRMESIKRPTLPFERCGMSIGRYVL